MGRVNSCFLRPGVRLGWFCHASGEVVRTPPVLPNNGVAHLTNFQPGASLWTGMFLPRPNPTPNSWLGPRRGALQRRRAAAHRHGDVQPGHRHRGLPPGGGRDERRPVLCRPHCLLLLSSPLVTLQETSAFALPRRLESGTCTCSFWNEVFR